MSMFTVANGSPGTRLRRRRWTRTASGVSRAAVAPSGLTARRRADACDQWARAYLEMASQVRRQAGLASPESGVSCSCDPVVSFGETPTADDVTAVAVLQRSRLPAAGDPERHFSALCACCAT
ncbi:hypothetical protein HPB50_002324 [Hyalomma asiaticum]|uniref:Uncharacterized protein n=1 Tax=Hyalomma asiaticum TaxID=266040 RepID=A0ACB7S134_HYAAI|nr:hypothetical protein HPB50_002324 [Hyalomma asiaticum]